MAPFDSLERMRDIAKLILEQVGELRTKGVDDKNRAEYNVMLERSVKVLKEIMPYEFARLASIDVKGDPNNPIRHVHDLSKLNREQLLGLRAILAALG